MSRGASEARAENSEGGTVLECVAHGHAIAVCQIVEAATRVVKWSEGNPGVELPFEQDSSQQQISAEQMELASYIQATAELDRQEFVIRKQIEVLRASTCRGRQTALAGKALHMLAPPLKPLSKSFGPRKCRSIPA